MERWGPSGTLLAFIIDDDQRTRRVLLLMWPLATVLTATAITIVAIVLGSPVVGVTMGGTFMGSIAAVGIRGLIGRKRAMAGSEVRTRVPDLP